MASFSEEHLCCPICHEIFKDPVLLSCSHSFCKTCLQCWWTQGQTDKCPVCRVSSQFEPAGNLVLKNLCEVVSQQRAGMEHCHQHSEKLHLFCLDHQQPVCLVCRDSEEHTHHSFRPVAEAAGTLRKKLCTTLQAVQVKVKKGHLMENKLVDMSEHIKTQAQNTKRLIQEQFQRMHQFLEEEEEARISALMKEEEHKSHLMKQKLEALRQHTTDLSNIVRATEKGLKAADVPFLLNYKAAVRRVEECPLLEPPTLPKGALIDVAKHLGNLSFNIWNKMKDIICYSPVVLDPNTASSDLVLSEELNSVSCEETEPLPENPERLRSFAVLSREGFSSGTHCWDVEVGNNRQWELGVCEEWALKKENIYSGLWRIGDYNHEYKKCCPSQKFTNLSVQEVPQRIRVKLDWDKGVLSFSDAVMDKHIHTYTHTFTDKLFAFISTISEHQLRILPIEVSVAVGQR